MPEHFILTADAGRGCALARIGPKGDRYRVGALYSTDTNPEAERDALLIAAAFQTRAHRDELFFENQALRTRIAALECRIAAPELISFPAEATDDAAQRRNDKIFSRRYAR